LELEVKIEDPKDKRKKTRHVANQPPASVATTAATTATAATVTPSQPVDADDENIEEVESELELKYGAQHVIKLFIPVTLCLIFVIISLSVIKSYQKSDGATL
jgi:hypothetical protein